MIEENVVTWEDIQNEEVAEGNDITFYQLFVKNVCDFSSQYGSNTSVSYTADNITGSPSTFPHYGDFPSSFVMRTYGTWWDKAPSKLLDYMPQNNEGHVSHDYIDIKYSIEVYPIRVSIYENYNPGSVIAIWAQNSHGQWTRLWSGPPQIVSCKSRIFSPYLKPYYFKTKMLRLEFNHSQLDYYTELDAVLLIGSSVPLVSYNLSYNENLDNFLKDLGCGEIDRHDIYNLTPDFSTANVDIMTNLEKIFQKYRSLPKSNITINIPKGKLVATLEQHCVPPIEEAFKSLHQFLQGDFPKFMKEIQLSLKPPALSESISSPKTASSTSHETNYEPCGNLSALPDETVLKILKNLDLKSLCHLCRVNKHFNNIARDALLYTSLNLKPYWYCLNSAALSYLAPRCQYLQRLDLSWCGNYNMITCQDVVNFLSTCGSLLTHLRLNCCNFVNDLILCEISKTCKNLRELCLRNCNAITNNGFSKLEALESLQRLELYRTTIETSTLCSILRRNPQMKHLNLAAMPESLNIDDVALELGNSCVHLESVDFWKAQTLTMQGVRSLTHCTNLREVDFGWCSGISTPGDSLRALLYSCPHLEKVFLAALRGLTDRDLEPLLISQELQQIDLLGCRSITPEMCYCLLSCCPKLQMIDLSFCETLFYMNIEEWRLQYPHVSIKTTLSGALM